MNTLKKMTVELTNETSEQIEPLLNDQISEVVHLVLNSEGLDVNGEVSILFVDNKRIKELNNEYRNKNVETDVLSFPQYESIKDNGTKDAYLYLGDIVISLEKAKEQAESFRHSFEREILYLVVHSMLHLLGYDHMVDDEKGEMRGKEKEIFRKIAIFKA